MVVKPQNIIWKLHIQLKEVQLKSKHKITGSAKIEAIHTLKLHVREEFNQNLHIQQTLKPYTAATHLFMNVNLTTVLQSVG